MGRRAAEKKSYFELGSTSAKIRSADWELDPPLAYTCVFTYTPKLVNHVTDVLIHLNNNVVPVFGHGKTEFRSDL